MKPCPVSVVIATVDRPRDLVRALASVMKQAVRPEELVLVDQSKGSESEREVGRWWETVPEEEKPLTRLTHHRDSSLSGLTAARNVGMRLARGEIVLFLDDEVELEGDFLAELLAAYERHPEAGGVGGAITNYRANVLSRLFLRLFYRGSFRDQRREIYWRLARYTGEDDISVNQMTGAVMSYRKDILEDFPFDEELQGYSWGEDFEHGYRVSRTRPLFICPRARVCHHRSPGRRGDRWKARRREMSFALYFYRRHLAGNPGEALALVWLLSGIFLAGFKDELRDRGRLPVGGQAGRRLPGRGTGMR